MVRGAGFARAEVHGTEGVRFLPAVRSLGILCIGTKGG
jgi:hypothetical protein